MTDPVTRAQVRKRASGRRAETGAVRRPRLLVALGGNALLRRGEPLEAAAQLRNVERAARSISELATTHELVITHGNGPQVGLLALQSAAYKEVKPYPFDVLGAESEGMIGYLLEQALRNALPGRQTATLITQTLVAADDPAFEHPTKPIGPVYDETRARALAAELGWTIAADGLGYRRVVPSPEPQRIIELKAIALLVEAGVAVICSGGGGVPVAVADDGVERGIEAVIDKDLSAALLAEGLEADMLLLLTDVPSVERNWGTDDASPIRRCSPAELRVLHLDAGSMGPKVEAACRFVERTGGTAAIGGLDQAADIVSGEAGTIVMPSAPARRFGSARVGHDLGRPQRL